MYEFDSLCIYVFIHVKFIYDCNIWLYYQLTTVTDTYFRFLEENVVGMGNIRLVNNLFLVSFLTTLSSL